MLHYELIPAADTDSRSLLVTFDDLGHVPHEEDPERTVKPVLAFIGLN